jgi:hypothetical protein
VADQALALLPLALLWLYGAVRVSALFGMLGLLFHEPWHFAVAAAALAALSVPADGDRGRRPNDRRPAQRGAEPRAETGRD